MKRWGSLALVLAAVSAAGTVLAADFGPWAKQANIRFQSYNRPETLTNFPVLVVLSTNIPGFSYADFSSSAGADLRFGTNRFSELNYEIEKWNTNGASYVWVQVPRLADTNTTIYAFWGRATATQPTYTTNGATWDSSYVAVWHMSDTNALDSTINRNNGVSHNTVNDAGLADGAQALPDASHPNATNYISVATSTSLDSITAGVTLEAWVYLRAAKNFPMVIQRPTDSFSLRFSGGSQQPQANVTPSGADWISSPSAISLNQWHQLAFTYNGAGNVERLLVDGQVVASQTASGSLSAHQGQTLYIGRRDDGYPFYGSMDEVRMSKQGRSTNWVWATWMTTASNKPFAVYGAATTGAAPEIVGVIPTDVSVTAVTLTGNLVSTNGSATQASVYWGESDGGMSPANWGHTNAFSGDQPEGPLGTNVAVVAGKLYYYRYYATNATGETWSDPAITFITGDVTIQATDAAAAENGLDPATFTVSRPSWSVAAPLTVNFTIDASSTATYGADYTLSPSGSVTIAAGSTNATITLTPIHDTNVTEGSESVMLALAPGPYIIGTASNASASIADTAALPWYVSPSGADTNAGTSLAQAFLTVSNGVAHANAGDTVFVAAGTYVLGTNIVIDKAITVLGLDGAAATVLSGNNATRCAAMLHASAVLRGVTLANGYINTTTYLYLNGAGLYMTNGTVRDCIIRDCQNGGGSYGDGAGVYMTAGVLRDCTVFNNQNYGYNGSYAFGAGVHMAGAGLVSNCVIRNNYGSQDHEADGGGVYLNDANARLVDSTIVSNQVNGTHRPNGAGVYVQNGTVDRCVIAYNRNTGGSSQQDYQGGAGANIQNGTVRNCLIAANSHEHTVAINDRYGGGVRLQNGLLENCTVVRNYSAQQWGGVYRVGGSVVNCIITDNSSAGGTSNINTIVGVSYSCAPELPSGAGNFVDDPLFISRGSGVGLGAVLGDYHLRLESKCVDAGATGSSAADLNKTARPLDGIGDGGAEFDMGCYELDPNAGSLRCGFRTPTPSGQTPLQVVFTGSAAGTNNAITAWVWDFNNDGTPDGWGKVATNTYNSKGTYSVALTVTNSAGLTAALVRTNYVLVSAPTYVSLTGSHTSPYDTWDKAATNLQVAIDSAALGTMVLVTNGTYSIGAQVILNKGVTVQSVNGAEATILDAGKRCSVFQVANPGAVLDGFTLMNGYAANGAGVYLTGGTVKKCIIRNNRDLGAGPGGGVWMSDGLLQNCLVAGNRAGAGTYGAGRGGGIYIEGASSRIEHCTVARNAAGLSEGGVYKNGGVILNSILFDNRAPSATNVNTSVGVTNSCAPELPGSGNITASPQFSDSGTGYGFDLVGGNFRLGYGSPCVDGGTNLVALADDLDRGARPVDGNGDTVAVPDMGAYEMQSATNAGALRCSFAVSPRSRLAPATNVFTAYVAGSNTTSLAYSWDFTNDGTPDAAGQVATNVYLQNNAFYSVKLTAVNGAAETASYVWTNCIQMPFDNAYVSLAGGHQWPYTNWATAANEVFSGVDAIEGTNSPTVWVNSGSYTLTVQVVVYKGVTVRGTGGATNTVINGAGVTRCVSITHSGVVLDGFTVTNGYLASGSGAGINMTGGLVRNCLIVRNNCVWGRGGGLDMNGGTLESSTVQANLAHGHTTEGRGGGVHANNAVISNCVLRANTVNDLVNYQDNGDGGGAYLIGTSQLLNSLIVSNIAYSDHRLRGGGVYLESGAPTVANCVIQGNRCIPRAVSGQAVQGGAGVNMQAGLLRNCLVAGNSYEAFFQDGTANNRYGGGVRMDAGRMENCTVVRNSDVNYMGGVYVTGVATALNSIVYFNTAVGNTNINPVSAVSFSCAPDLVSGTGGNTSADPQFANAGSGYGPGFTNGDYHLKSSSPCINTGTNLAWVATGVDLDGAARQWHTVDMGCYEAPPPKGTMYFVR